MSKQHTARRPFQLPKKVGDNFIDSAVCSALLQNGKSDKKIMRKVRSFTDCLYPDQSHDSMEMMSHSNQLPMACQPASGTEDSPQIKSKINSANPFLLAKLQNLAKSPSKNSPVKIAVMGETGSTVQGGDEFVRFREIRERPLNLGGSLLMNRRF